MYKKLKLKDVICPVRSELKYYLDKGYICTTECTSAKILKDSKHTYPYRVVHGSINDKLYGYWSGYNLIVYKLPKPISFKNLLCEN